ncbi:MAG: AraC family transcriptional regulator, partial [Pseudomonadota bacterium]|nr:AraC family transcriptional regulator [Pseudomonadota bacterium]
PRGREHVLADSRGRTPAPLQQVIETSGFDGRGAFVVGSGDPHAATQMVCGHFSFAEGADHPLLRALPDHFVLSAGDRARHPLLDETLRLVSRQAIADGLGAAAAISRLSEVFFIESVRVMVDRCPELARLLAAMTDAQVGRALECLHGQPGKQWTLESIAAEVGMSRSRFAERFAHLVGVTPMTYLGEWRLQKALARLSQTQSSIKEVAHEAGYTSAAAFTRAFTRRFGQAPRDFRDGGFAG